MKIFIIHLFVLFSVSISFLMPQEMVIDGKLTITDQLDLSENRVTNVGSPVESNDAVNLNFLQSSLNEVSGLKLERIYRKYHNEGDTFSYTVPTNKVWLINALSPGFCWITINSNYLPLGEGTTKEEYNLWAFSSDTFASTYCGSWLNLTVYEYSISGTGSEQGLDYIEP